MINVIKKLREIFIHNKRYEQGKENFKRDLNDFSDLTEQESSNRLLMKQMPEKKLLKSTAEEFPDLPEARESVDYRKEGLVGQIGLQLYCGSCFAWSSAAVLEGQLRKCGIYNESVSVQLMVDCPTKGCKKCDGGIE